MVRVCVACVVVNHREVKIKKAQRLERQMSDDPGIPGAAGALHEP